MKSSVNVLGTKYTIERRTKEQDLRLQKVDGYCDYTSKIIVCVKHSEKDKDIMDLDNFKPIYNRILRHELIHAFIYESGLWGDSFGVSRWAENEEMTDWIAMQFPKIYKVFSELEILD